MLQLFKWTEVGGCFYLVLALINQAGEFLIPGKNAVSEETELNENIHSNNDYVETASLLEQVRTLMPVSSWTLFA